MTLHKHRGPWRETLRAGLVASLDDEGRGVLTPCRVTERRRTCDTCGRLDEITTRDGRRWRRTTRPARWTPPEPSAYWTPAVDAL